MTALDKVFIKAYGKSATAHVPAPSSAPLGRRIDSAHSIPASMTIRDGVQTVIEELPTAAKFAAPPAADPARIDARHETPRPHWPPVMPKSSIAVKGSMIAEAAPDFHVQPSVPTLETLPAEAPTVTTVAADNSQPLNASPSRAAFEVDRFLWPEVCQRLMAAAHWSEASRELAAAAREGLQVFVIASQHRGEGRTTLALCLAQRLAEKHLRVTLVDADFHRPQLARSLKLLPAATWDDVLRGTLPLTESWIESVEDGITLLPLKEKADTTGLIGNPRLKEMFSLLRRTSDLVLIDAGSMEDFGDREVLALLGGTAQIDGALVVRDVRKTATGELEQTPTCLDALGIARVDVVENFVRS